MKIRQKIMENRFLFEELVGRDFKKKYKRTLLGMGWSVLSPLINLLIMWLVFSNLLGKGVDHYVIYLFSGQMIFSFFSDATTLGMTSLYDNASIFTKVNIPKYMFLLSQNVSSLINFGLTLAVFFVFVAIDGVPFSWRFLLLVYPIVCVVLFNLGVGLILSALYVFFRDMLYLWRIATQLILWMSATFYSIETFPPAMQKLFLLNPLYVAIRYVRMVVLEAAVPSMALHALLLVYALVAVGAGAWMYRRYNTEFLYYV